MMIDDTSVRRGVTGRHLASSSRVSAKGGSWSSSITQVIASFDRGKRQTHG
jgi:hypothetical protein